MSTAAAIASLETPIRKYELGRPIIRREQRLAFEAIHRAIAQTWSESMADSLRGHLKLEFEGLDFAAFSSVAVEEDPCAQTMLFSIASTPINGFMMMTGALTRFLVSGRLGMGSAIENSAGARFTRIEAAIARETARSMLASLGEAYTAAGLGIITNLRECEDLADSFLFEPEEPIALLRFRISGTGEDLSLLIALSGSIVAALAEHQPAEPADGDSRAAIIEVVRRLPIEVEVVLGSWRASIAELTQLQVGDRIVLPDGGDAWLAARGIRIRKARGEITADAAIIDIL